MIGELVLGIGIGLSVAGIYAMIQKNRMVKEGLLFYFRNKNVFELCESLREEFEHFKEDVHMKLEWIEGRLNELEQSNVQSASGSCGMMYSKTDEIKRLVRKGLPDNEIMKITGCSYRELELVKEVFKERGSG